MTRVNVGIKPEELPRQLLIAEHREIKRIPNVIKSGRFSLKGQPSTFKLGEGHVKFFYDKVEYVRKRYESLYKECIRRGYKMTYFGDSFKEVPQEFMNDYYPTDRDRELIIERIQENGLDILRKK